MYIRTFEYLLNDKYPNILKHLKQKEIHLDIFIIEWFYTMFGRAFDF